MVANRASPASLPGLLFGRPRALYEVHLPLGHPGHSGGLHAIEYRPRRQIHLATRARDLAGTARAGSWRGTGRGSRIPARLHTPDSVQHPDGRHGRHALRQLPYIILRRQQSGLLRQSGQTPAPVPDSAAGRSFLVSGGNVRQSALAAGPAGRAASCLHRRAVAPAHAWRRMAPSPLSLRCHLIDHPAELLHDLRALVHPLRHFGALAAACTGRWGGVRGHASQPDPLVVAPSPGADRRTDRV